MPFQSWLNSVIRCAVFLSLCAGLSALPKQKPFGQPAFNAQLRTAFGEYKGAAIVLRVQDERILAVHNAPVLARRVATPGSSIKPFTLQFLLEHHLLKPAERMACRRSLTINRTRLNCSHSNLLPAFDAQEALAFSCNSYFAEAAKRLPPAEFEQFLREIGFESNTALLPDEAQGRIRFARTIEERQLLGIGAAGIEVTPLELALAYTRLARRSEHPTASDRVVLDALSAATEYGLAQGAQPEGTKVAGKTGTAADKGSAVTHAWFAGFAPVEKPEVVVVVFVERARGSIEATSIARRIFKAWESTGE